MNQRMCHRTHKSLFAVFLLCLLLTGCAAKGSSENGSKMPEQTPPTQEGEKTPPKTDEAETPVEGETLTITGLNAAQEEAKAIMDGLQPADFKGAGFTIAAVTPQTFVSDSDDNFVNTSLYFRNKLIRDKYNINLSVIGLPDTAKSKEDLQIAVLAGKQYADVLSMPMKNVGIYAADGLLINLRSLPFLNFNADYMKNSFADEMTIKGRTYSLYGDAVLQNDAMWVMFFNKDLIALAGGASPYDLVKSGEWNWDTLLAMSAKLPKTAEAQNSADKKKTSLKLYGQGAFNNPDQLRFAAWEAGGQSFYAKDNNGYFYANFYNDTFQNAIGMLRRVTMTENKLLKENLTGSERELFLNKQLMFCAAPVSFARELIGSGLSFGMVPMPKLYTAQSDYYTWLGNDVPCIAVPSNCNNTERTGLVVNALYAASYRHLELSQRMDYINYYFGDNASASYYDRLKNNKKTSIAYALGEGIPVFADSSYGFLRSAVLDGGGMDSLYKKAAEALAKYEIRTY